MAEQIWVGEDLHERMDEKRSPGQSFAGYIKELMNDDE